MKDVFQLLKELSLSGYEARTYTRMLNSPGTTAPQIARETNIPTSKMYDVLNRLINKGFVVENAGKPKKFRAMEPEIAIGSLSSKIRDNLDNIESTTIEKLNSTTQHKKDDGIWHIKGRENVEALLEKVISSTENRLVIRYSPGMMCLERVMVLLNGKTNGIEIDSRENSVNTNLVNSDGREMILYLNKKEAIWIRNTRYCKVLEDGSSEDTNSEKISYSQRQS